MHFTTHTKLAAPKALVEKHIARGYKRSSTANGIAAERPTAEMLAMMEHLDNELGRMFKQLDDWKQTENTLIVFTADNGGLTRVQSCAPLREGKGSPYEGGIRVPLIASWPTRIQHDSVCDLPVHTVDFYPTFVELAKAEPPAGAVLDGISLIPLMTQTKTNQDRALYWHMPTYTTNFGRTPCSIVQQGGWKLIHWFGDYLDTNGFTPGDQPYGKLILGPRTELYHLSRDLSETTDLASTHPEKVAELKQRLKSWWLDTKAPLPTTNPNFDQETWWHLPVDPIRAKRAKSKEKAK